MRIRRKLCRLRNNLARTARLVVLYFEDINFRRAAALGNIRTWVVFAWARTRAVGAMISVMTRPV